MTIILQDIVECYRFICDNYAVGDEIVLIGFSRGAFTARSVADMVCTLGFLNHAGIEQLPHIFNDYKQLLTWKNGFQFDEKKHFLGFTLENAERVEKKTNVEHILAEKDELIKMKMKRGDAWEAAREAFPRAAYRGNKDEMQRDLSKKKEKKFYDIVEANKNGDTTEKIAKTGAEYRKMLAEVG
jgi:hypothetical protein